MFMMLNLGAKKRKGGHCDLFSVIRWFVIAISKE